MDASASAISYFLEGSTYNFCSESCKEKFVDRPQDYLSENEQRVCKNLKQVKDYADSINMGSISKDTLKGSLRRYTCLKDKKFMFLTYFEIFTNRKIIILYL